MLVLTRPVYSDLKITFGKLVRDHVDHAQRSTSTVERNTVAERKHVLSDVSVTDMLSCGI